MIYTVYIIVLNTDDWGGSVGHQIPLIETIEELAWGRETVQIHIHLPVALSCSLSSAVYLPSVILSLFKHSV